MPALHLSPASSRQQPTIPVWVATAGMDQRQNERGYTVPGLDDAGLPA
jgi:uracil phosphoribosyltransferase